MTARMPTAFVSHGSPMNVLFPEATLGWRRWAADMPRPRAVLVISAHWETVHPTLGAQETLPLIYDFYGFPPPLYELTYAPPGAPALAERVRELSGGAWPTAAARGWDHGTWVPLLSMYPKADIPLLQVSLPHGADTAAPWAMGEQLRPLRDEGVLILGSGSMTHNLATARPGTASAPPDWALAFDAWAASTLSGHDVDALLDVSRTAPDFAMNQPTRPSRTARSGGKGCPAQSRVRERTRRRSPGRPPRRPPAVA